MKTQTNSIFQNFFKKIASPKVKRLLFLKDVKTMYEMLKDSKVSNATKATIVGALLYFISPVDAIPDVALVVGYIDDAGVISFALNSIAAEVEKYKLNKKRSKK